MQSVFPNRHQASQSLFWPCILTLTFLAAPAFAQRGGRGGGPAIPQNLAFRFMGPAVGNRIASAAGVPSDPTVYYAGAASGGVWKSTDSGRTWAPIFDSQPVMAIGALAVSTSDPKQVWAGTGEAWAIRDSDMIGNGIYKSTDAGASWQHMGLDETGRIGRIIVHPTNPSIVYVCALGRTTGPQEERGVYKTSDGGQNWTRVLFAGPNAGCSGLSMDASDPNTLFAGMWQVEMHTYAMFSGGPASAAYVSHDAGSHWTELEGHGLPKSPVGKIDVAIAPSNSKRVYALIQTADQGSLWRSDDGGVNWTNGSWQRELIGRAGYYIRLAVNPKNPDELFVANSSFWTSKDGGKSFTTLGWGGDTHDIWIDPGDPNRIVMTHDGGMFMTTDHGTTSNRVTLPIGQMYHVAVDNDVPYKVYGNMQDDGTMRGPSNVQEAGANVPGQNVAGRGGRGGGFGGGRGGGGATGPWEHGLGGCESGFTLPDLTNTDIVWASCYGDEVTRYDAKTKVARSVSPWLHTLDSEPNKAKYRCHWTPPLAVDPFDHNAVYYGCQVVFRTTSAGQAWTVISEDLSTRDPKYIISSGGLVGDNLGQFYGEVVFAIAPSEIQRGLVWAGTNDGKVWYTRDSLAASPHWTDVTKNIPNLPPMGVISKIEPSHFDAGTAYICVDFHLADNRDPWVYKTTDFGKTWNKISGDLPTRGPLTYARVIAENPNKKGMLFAGTGNALYYSMNDGQNWKQLNEGLPAAPVSWIVVQKASHDLVVSTYGRGIYIMDDITPLEQGMMEPSFTAAAALAAPRTAFREPRGGRAQIDFKLAAAPKTPDRVHCYRFQRRARRQAASSHRPCRIEPHLLGYALPAAATGGVAHHATRKSTHLGGAAVSGSGYAARLTLGHRPGRDRPIRRARRLHRQDDRGGSNRLDAAAHRAAARRARNRRRHPGFRPAPTQGARRYQQRLGHDQPARMDAQASRRSAQDRGGQGRSVESYGRDRPEDESRGAEPGNRVRDVERRQVFSRAGQAVSHLDLAECRDWRWRRRCGGDGRLWRHRDRYRAGAGCGEAASERAGGIQGSYG